MLEESIEASPNRLDSSIRKSTLHRKMKRKRYNYVRSNPVDNQKLLQMLYDDESEESTRTLTQENSYKCFEAENRLANADRFDESCKLRKSGLMQPTQEFWTCERLMETQQDILVKNLSVPLDEPLDTIFLSCQGERHSYSAVENLNLSFESEWVLEDFENDKLFQVKDCEKDQLDASTFLDQTLVPNACDRTLQESEGLWDINTKGTFVDLSPKDRPGSKTIVDAILEDFCSSPNTSETEHDKPDPEDIMPFFRFRRKKIRTYERCWRHAAQFAKTNVEIRYTVDDGLSDGSESSSGLSVQEDKSQRIPTLEPLEHLSTSSRIRNNLLNLSAFFTQNIIDSDRAEETSPTIDLLASEDASNTDADIVQSTGFEGIKRLIADILTLRAKYPVSYGLSDASGQCDKNFRGFLLRDQSSDYTSDRHETPQNRNIVSQMASTIMQKSSCTTEHSSPKITNDYVENTKKHQISFDEDSWQQDRDFFADFQTQVVFKASNTEIVPIRRKSDFTLHTSKCLHEQSTLCKIMSEGPDCKRNGLETQYPFSLNIKRDGNESLHSKNTYIEGNVIESQISVEDILQLFDETRKFDTSQPSNEKFETSKSLEMNFDCMLLSEWPLDEQEKDEIFKIDENSSYDKSHPRSRPLNEREDSVKSKNEVMTSAQLNDLHNFSKIVNSSTMNTERQVSTMNKTEDHTSSTGSHTASRKHFVISGGVQRKYPNLLVEMEGTPDRKTDIFIPNTKASVIAGVESDGFPIMNRNNATFASTCFTDTSTPSRKFINVSEEERIKAINTFPQLPDLPKEQIEIPSRSTKEDESMVLPLLNFLSESNKNKAKTSTCFTGFLTASRKPINVSEEARNKVVEIFAQLPELADEQIETHCQNTKEARSMPRFSNENKRNKASDLTYFTGFHTASCKPINVSEEARNKVVDIFAQLPELPSEQLETPSQKTKEPRNMSNFLSESNNNKGGTSTCFIGFHTASRKLINVSEKSRDKIIDIFAQLPEPTDKKIETPSQNTNETRSLPNLSNNSNRDELGASTCFTGFHTASRKPINVSEEARNKVVDIFAQLPDLPDEQTVFPQNAKEAQIIPSKLPNLLNESHRNKASSSTYLTSLPETQEEQKDKPSRIVMKVGNSCFNKKEVRSSICHSDFHTPFRKRELPPVAEDTKADLDINQMDNLKELAYFPLSEWIPSCQSLKANQTNEVEIAKDLSMKRKFHTIENVYKNEQPTKLICGSHILNENSTHSPINSNHRTTSKLIGRKNLLSLTKRRRESLRTENNIKRHVSANFVETPGKSISAACVPKNVLTPDTPQACTFYAQLPTASSTPLQLKPVAVTDQALKNSVDNLESDFKRINWENTDDCQINNVITPTRANSSGLNKSLKSQPSPVERLENLSSCGDPPPLLQLVDSNSRSRNLGLSRRWRDSIQKR